VCCFPGVYSPLRQGVRVRVRARAVQVAPVADPAEGETAHHVGLQDPLPRRALPARCEEVHLRRC